MNCTPRPAELNPEHLYDAVFKFLNSRINSIEDAQDLTQEVFLKVSKSRRDSQPVANLKAWVYRIAKNTLTDYYRKKHIPLTDLEGNAEPKNDDDNETLIAALEKCLNGYMNNLNPETKELIKAADLKGKSQKEIAATLQLSYATVRSKIQRGRNQIKRMFLDDCRLEMSTTGQVLACTHKNKKKS